jgi:hypothetical protein
MKRFVLALLVILCGFALFAYYRHSGIQKNIDYDELAKKYGGKFVKNNEEHGPWEKYANAALVTNAKLCDLHLSDIHSDRDPANLLRYAWQAEHSIALNDGYGPENVGMTDENLRTCLMMTESQWENVPEPKK